ncbi:hypothetical protein Tco_1173862 [Tanacetum coccineum]
MVPFYKNELGFTKELKTSSSFTITGLLQPWQMLCKIFSKCLKTRITGWDQPPLQIMQMMYCFINNIHVDYAELLWEGLHYSLHHPTSLIPLSQMYVLNNISHYMTNFPEISRRARDTYHNLKDDDIMKNIFNLGRHKDKAEVFRIDVPLTQSQPTESTQGMNRTPIAPRSPNPKVDARESSAPKRSTVIHFRIPQRRSTRLTPPAPVPTVDKADEIILEDTLQNDDQTIPETRTILYLFETLRAKFLSRKSFDTLADHLQEVMVESLPTMVDKHIKEQVEKQVQVPVYVAKGLLLERQQNKEESNKMIAKAMLQERGRLQAEISSQIQQAINNNIPSLVDASVRNYMSGHILHVHPAQPQTTSIPEQQYQLTSPVRLRDQDDLHDDAPPEGRIVQSGRRPLNDDETPMKQVSQDIMEEVSLTINEAELKKIADEMLRQRCTSGDEHQYHIDQMKNFLKSDIVWEAERKFLHLHIHERPHL